MTTEITDISSTLEFIKALSDLTNDPTMPSQQQTLLLTLYVHGTVSQGNLEGLTGVKASSNSRNIGKLGPGERAFAGDGPNLLENYEDPRNRRIKMVRLTPKGHALLEECWTRSFGKYNELRNKVGISA